METRLCTGIFHIPTDGSELTKKAILSGIVLAKVVGAKVTGITVTVPSQILTLHTPTLPPLTATLAQRWPSTDNRKKPFLIWS